MAASASIKEGIASMGFDDETQYNETVSGLIQMGISILIALWNGHCGAICISEEDFNKVAAQGNELKRREQEGKANG